MVEIVENKVSKLEQKIDVLVIAGLTLFWNYEQKFYQELWDAIRGIKKMVQKTNTYIIITSLLNKYSDYKPEGGKFLQHFGQAHILILKKENYAEYSIIQHLYPKESTLKHYYPRKPKVNKREQVKNKKLDVWL